MDRKHILSTPSGKSVDFTDAKLNLNDNHLWAVNKKKQVEAICFDLLPYVLKELLLLCVSLVELINTTCGVNELHLTCVEWV